MTSAAEFLRTSRRFVGGDAHIAPRGIIEFALDFRKIGLYRRVDVGIDPYAQLQGFRESRRGIDPYARTVKSGIIRKSGSILKADAAAKARADKTLRRWPRQRLKSPRRLSWELSLCNRTMRS